MTIISNMLSAMNRANYCDNPDQLTNFKSVGFKYGFAGKSGPGRTYAVNKQVHDANIIEIEPNHQNVQTPADGIWTKEKGKTVAVRTADCLPVLFADRNGTMVMAVHAGWRGLCAGILSRAVDLFKDEGIATNDIIAAIGPAISRERYEVGPEVINAFYESPIKLPEAAASLCVAKGKGDRWYLDLQTGAMANLMIKGLGPEQISLLQICTFSDDRYFSYRREGKNVGSNISWIELV
jgi:YfiH family protein